MTTLVNSESVRSDIVVQSGDKTIINDVGRRLIGDHEAGQITIWGKGCYCIQDNT